MSERTNACEKCGTPDHDDGVPRTHICTPTLSYALKKIEELEWRISKLERFNDSMNPGWD